MACKHEWERNLHNFNEQGSLCIAQAPDAFHEEDKLAGGFTHTGFSRRKTSPCLIARSYQDQSELRAPNSLIASPQNDQANKQSPDDDYSSII